MALTDLPERNVNTVLGRCETDIAVREVHETKLPVLTPLVRSISTHTERQIQGGGGLWLCAGATFDECLTRGHTNPEDPR
jgi:hypothetical protein